MTEATYRLTCFETGARPQVKQEAAVLFVLGQEIFGADTLVLRGLTNAVGCVPIFP